MPKVKQKMVKRVKTSKDTQPKKQASKISSVAEFSPTNEVAETEEAEEQVLEEAVEGEDENENDSHEDDDDEDDDDDEEDDDDVNPEDDDADQNDHEGTQAEEGELEDSQEENIDTDAAGNSKQQSSYKNSWIPAARHERLVHNKEPWDQPVLMIKDYPEETTKSCGKFISDLFIYGNSVVVGKVLNQISPSIKGGRLGMPTAEVKQCLGIEVTIDQKFIKADPMRLRCVLADFWFLQAKFGSQTSKKID